MPSSGPLSAGAGATVDAGVGSAWVNPGNITSSNNLDAECALSDGEQSDYLVATSFGFAIPVGATIDGVVVEVEAASSSQTPILSNAFLTTNGTATTGTDQLGTNIQVDVSDAYYTIGGAANVWGASLSSTIVNSSTFGVMIRAFVSGTAVGNFDVDHIRMTIHYTEAAPGTGQPMWTRRGGLWRPARIGVR